MIVENSFPRGGKLTREAEAEKRKENIEFGASQIKEAKKKSRKRNAEKLEIKKGDDVIRTVSAELLNYSTIQDGMNIMGLVDTVDPLYIDISLPGYMTARVSALEVSDAYTKVTREFLQSADGVEHYKPLHELYHIGQIVYGKVQDVKKNSQITFSLKPSEVHADLVRSRIEPDFFFNGAIQEVQDHGYIIETGIRGLRTFLPKDKAISSHSHAIGELVYLKVLTIRQDKAASTCTCKEVRVQELNLGVEVDNLDHILPGTIVKFNVTKALKNGLQGTVMDEEFMAYVNEHQLSEPLSSLEDFKPNNEYLARVLYIMPLTKLIYLTLNLHNPSKKVQKDALVPHYKKGDIIEKAKVQRIGTGGIILALDKKFKGLISFSTIKQNRKGNFDQDAFMAKYAAKTKHKVRVLRYDRMDCMYLCTDKASAIEEKYFCIDDVHPGEFVVATVKRHDNKIGGYLLKVGNLTGIIEKLFLASTTKTLNYKQELRCRVLSVDVERKTVYLTNRPEYLKKNCKVLLSLADAKKGAVFMGTIVQCAEAYFLVKFFNNLKGVLFKNKLGAAEIAAFREGQTMQFNVEDKTEEQITLTLVTDSFSLGEICPVTVTNKLDSGLEIKIEYSGEGSEEEARAMQFRGLIPMRLLSDYTDLLLAKMQMFAENTQTEAVCIASNIFSLRDVQYFRQHLLTLSTVRIGDILRACIKNVTNDVVELMLPLQNYGKLVKVHLNLVLINALQKDKITFSPEQVVYVKVLGKELSTKSISVSAKLTDVWDGRMDNIAEYLLNYLKEVADIKAAFKSTGKSIANYSIGAQVEAQFEYVNAETNDWHYKLKDTRITAVVKASLVGKRKPPAVGELERCLILWIDYSMNVVLITNRAVDVARITDSTQLPTNLVGKGGVSAKILLVLENVIICSLKKQQNPLIFCPIRLHHNDFEQLASHNLQEGNFCRLTFVHQTAPIAVLESTWELWKQMRHKRESSTQASVVAKKAKIVSTEEESVVSDDKNSAPAKQKQLAKSKKSADSAASSDEENDNNSHAVPKPANNFNPNRKYLPSVKGFFNAADTVATRNAAASSDEDEDSDDGTPSHKKKKLTKVEKYKQARDEEKHLRAIEEKLADPKQMPETVDQFDRLVLSSPNDSKVWINYMVFYLQSAEVDKARSTAQRALKAISYRNDEERLNVWVAWLNLELRYGGKDAFDDVLKEALTYNDPLKVYLRAIEILTAAEKTDALKGIIGIVTKKFRAEPAVWRAAADAYFSIKLVQPAQQLLHKALACLPEREHVNTIVTFANLNQKHDEHEMAQTLLDQIVTSYPKRVDVWTQYVDLLVKQKLIDSARGVLERAVIQKIPLKKMRTIFVKYLEFEKTFGTEESVQNVKKLAEEFVKKNSHL